MLALLAIILGLLLGLFLSVNIPNFTYMYLAILVLATLSALVEGVKQKEEKTFTNLSFLLNWLSHTFVALVMNALGDAMGIDLATPVIIFLGIQIFQSLTKLTEIFIRKLQNRQKTIKVWMERTSRNPEELPIEVLSGEKTERQKRVDELREQAKQLRIEADSLLNEADVLFEEEAMHQLAQQESALAKLNTDEKVEENVEKSSNNLDKREDISE